jgi:hypothetical protein
VLVFFCNDSLSVEWLSSSDHRTDLPNEFYCLQVFVGVNLTGVRINSSLF